MNGRTPATKATTKRLSSDSISSLFSLLHDPGTILEKDLSVCCSGSDAGPSRELKSSFHKLSTDRQKLRVEWWRKGMVHLPVNLAEVFLSRESLEERNNKQWSGIKQWGRGRADCQERCWFLQKAHEQGPHWTPWRSKSQSCRHRLSERVLLFWCYTQQLWGWLTEATCKT